MHSSLCLWTKLASLKYPSSTQYNIYSNNSLIQYLGPPFYNYPNHLIKYHSYPMAQSSIQQNIDMKSIINRSMGKLTFRHALTKGIRYGTGLLINNSLILTPAHNIFDRATQSYYQRFQFSFEGYNHSESYKVSNYWLLDDYQSIKSEKQSTLYDYGLLQLQEPLNHESLCQSLLPMQKQNSQNGSVAKYKKEIEILSNDLIACKQRLNMANKQCTMLNESNSQLRQQNNELSNYVHQLKDQIFKLQQGQASLSSNIPFEANQSMVINESVEQSFLSLTSTLNFSIQSLPLKLDLSSPPLSKYYSIQDQRLKCIQVNHKQYKLVSSQPLPSQSKTQFKLIRYSDKNSFFCIGLMSEKAKNSGNQKAANETVQYWSYKSNETGRFKMNGQTKLDNSSFHVKEGNIITIDADLQGMKIKFKNNSTAGVFPLSDNFKGKKMYIFLMIFNKEDEIQIKQ